MTSDRRDRLTATQPELPLPSSPDEVGRRRPGDWHLDEETRRIGRQGVAAARALLGGPPDTDLVPDHGDRGRTGRAA